MNNEIKMTEDSADSNDIHSLVKWGGGLNNML